VLFPGLSLHPAVGATRPEAQRRCHIGQGHFLRIGQGRSHKNGGRTSAGNVGRFCHSIHRSIHSSIYLIESIYNVYIIIYACLHVYTYACTYVESTNMDAYIYIYISSMCLGLMLVEHGRTICHHFILGCGWCGVTPPTKSTNSSENGEHVWARGIFGDQWWDPVHMGSVFKSCGVPGNSTLWLFNIAMEAMARL